MAPALHRVADMCAAGASTPEPSYLMETHPGGVRLLRTSLGDFPLAEYRLRIGGREWSILHTEAVLSYGDEARYLGERGSRPPYGVALWPAAVALAHEVASRVDAMLGRRVLELGAGTGLPGIVAAALGAQVVQSDRLELALSVCRRNGARNGVLAVEYRLADWSTWDDETRYDCILGADILYGESTHPHLRRILASNLADGGRVLLADPYRAMSMPLLEAMEADGWTIAHSRWSVAAAGEEDVPRPVGIFELLPPR